MEFGSADTPTADGLCQCLHFKKPDGLFYCELPPDGQTTFLLLHLPSQSNGNDIICCHHNFRRHAWIPMRALPPSGWYADHPAAFDFRRLFKFLCLNGSLLFCSSSAILASSSLMEVGAVYAERRRQEAASVNQVDCLIRQESLRYIACRKP